jgi:hypothetical protein
MTKDEIRAASHAQIDTAVALILVTVNDAGTGLRANMNGTGEENLILAGMCRGFCTAINASMAKDIFLDQQEPES